ncbi:MAG: HAMP domain-containing protein [Calditrichaeota bacterium]|nr:HAMP domain-containing protein [Calditrichota bacterium]
MFKKISLKLIIAVGVSISVIIGVYAYVTIHSQTETLLLETEHNNNELSETIKSSTRFDMLTNNWTHLHQIIKTIGSQPSILDVRIFNKEGTVIYSPKEDHIGMMVDKKAEACFTCHATDEPLQKLSISDRIRIFETDSGRVMGSINPIYNEPSCYEADCHAHYPDQTVLGVLDITISLKEIDERIEAAKMEMFIFTVITILSISAVLWFFVTIWVDKPVNELLEATKVVGSGNLNYSIDSNSSDEIGILARSFNTMTKKLAEARMQLFQSDKMASLGRLAAGVAHEINNPLTGILTYSSFLLKRTKNQPEFQEDLAVIVRETKRSREIVKGLLDFARQSVPKKNNAQINTVIDRAVTVIENQLSLNHLKLIRKFDERLPSIVVDENQMQQVFINLIVNSIHATKENGQITISTSLISLPPYGIVKVKNALCPKGHNLMDETVKINGMPTIRVQAKVESKEGYINLDPVYGKNRNHYGIKLDANTHVELSCPKCAISLLDKKKKCPKCGGPVYFFEVPGKGRFEGCAAKGCEWQFWSQIEEEGPKEYVEITVQDTGSGIPKEIMSKIFDPFFTTKGQKGTGLGLAVIWGIIDNHNGRITVDSEVGHGTTFTIRLPAANA